MTLYGIFLSSIILPSLPCPPLSPTVRAARFLCNHVPLVRFGWSRGGHLAELSYLEFFTRNILNWDLPGSWSPGGLHWLFVGRSQKKLQCWCRDGSKHPASVCGFSCTWTSASPPASHGSFAQPFFGCLESVNVLYVEASSIWLSIAFSKIFWWVH